MDTIHVCKCAACSRKLEDIEDEGYWAGMAVGLVVSGLIACVFWYLVWRHNIG